jgi:hypothetical protein
MELPDDVLNIIKEYAQPITRPDWRRGCYYNRFPYRIFNINYTFKYFVVLIYRMYRYKIVNLYDNMIYTELMLMTVLIN